MVKHVVIVGGGVSGLATAHHIAREGEKRGQAIRTTVFEGESRAGGRVWTERVDGFQIEVGANSFLDSKQSTLDLCRAIELGPDLIPARSAAKNRFVCVGNRLHAVPGGVTQFLRSGLLSWRGKVRMICERWVRARRDGADESIRQFACRRIGREAADVLVDAMVTGIHAGDAELLSVAAAFPRVIQLEREYGSLFRALSAIRRKRLAESRSGDSLPSNRANATSAGPGGTLWSLRHGMGQLIERLAADPRVSLTRNVPIRRLEPRSEGTWMVHAGSDEKWAADAVVLACPSFAQAEIVESMDPDLARLLGEIRYNSVTVVAFGFRASDLTGSIDGFGYLIPQRTRSDVLGVLWSSSIFDHRAPAGMVLLQAMCGGWNRPDIVSWDDDRIVRAVLDELRRTMNLAAQPALVRIVRWPRAIPQYHLGHLERVASIESLRKRHSKLYLTGNSFRGVAVNDCTEESARCAREVVGDLA